MRQPAVSVSVSVALAACLSFAATWVGGAATASTVSSPECLARTTPVPTGPAHLVRDVAVAGHGGRLHDLTLSSPALASDVHVDVLLPAGYAASGTNRYHVLYLLHGSGGSYTDWVDHGSAQLIADGSRAAHLPLTITVMPDGGLEGYYTDWYGRDVDQPSEKVAPGWSTYIVDEVIPYVDEHYRTIATRAGRAIAGLSMGGFGATSLPAQRPDLFAAAGSFSGADDVDYDYPYQNEVLTATNPAFTDGAPDACIWGDPIADRVQWEAVDPTYLAGNLGPVTLFVASGNGTPGPYDDTSGSGAAATYAAAGVESDIWDMNQAFVAQLDATHVAHTDYFYGDGTHSWPYWERDLTHFLPILARTWAHPAATPASFTYRSEAAAFGVWGWTFTTHHNVNEFTYVADASRSSFSMTGSGIVNVVTAALYPPRSRWSVTSGATPAVAVADAAGRLHFAISLGQSHATDQTSFPSGATVPSGWTTAHVTIALARAAP